MSVDRVPPCNQAEIFVDPGEKDDLPEVFDGKRFFVCVSLFVGGGLKRLGGEERRLGNASAFSLIFAVVFGCAYDG